MHAREHRAFSGEQFAIDERLVRNTALGVGIQVLLAALGASHITAQDVRRCPATIGSVAALCELDDWAGFFKQRKAPRYPDILRQAGVEGTVDMRYEIDTLGRISSGSVHFLHASHDLFMQSARSMLGQARFAAPRRNSSAVRLRVREIITFERGHELSRHFARPHVTLTIDSAGVLRTKVAAYPERDTTTAPLSDEETWAIYYLAGEHLMRDTKKTPSTYCMVVNNARPPDHAFARWRASGRRVVPLAECPRTYQSGMVRVQGDDPPPGWVNPIGIALLVLQRWTTDLITLEARVGSGEYVCEVVRELTEWRAVKCARTRSVVHKGLWPSQCASSSADPPAWGVSPV